MSKNNTSKLKKLFLYFAIIVIFIIVWVGVQKLISNYFPTIDFSLYEDRQNSNAFKKNILESFLSLVIIMPILEELVFRSLIKPQKDDIPLFISGLSSFVMLFVLKPYLDWYYIYPIIIILFAIIFFILKNYGYKSLTLYRLKESLEKKNTTTLVLVITSLLFGLSHALNYGNISAINITIILLTVPRIFSGFIYGIFKKKHGIHWSIGLHSFRNFLPFLISLI
ncbi:type II CAAX prenyl endopeptidase Rce1 family protein [Aquimarina sp. 2201CG5-10]|uniref:CPBP family glutamic-type intramembrane protease n=1 Tax=Aquimarina callyspongiae TaxID=3098150 RepID=UPI002AB3F37F|nr:CPBP family glutamic-type intramembrane protease [Aquimarina sp. 2201CG5-10]MDY8138931.1 CPBP family glutamic-type intramembrane protease [Aquimarina sp. 2201CG5-10]